MAARRPNHNFMQRGVMPQISLCLLLLLPHTTPGLHTATGALPLHKNDAFNASASAAGRSTVALPATPMPAIAMVIAASGATSAPPGDAIETATVLNESARRAKGVAISTGPMLSSYPMLLEASTQISAEAFASSWRRVSATTAALLRWTDTFATSNAGKISCFVLLVGVPILIIYIVFFMVFVPVYFPERAAAARRALQGVQRRIQRAAHLPAHAFVEKSPYVLSGDTIVKQQGGEWFYLEGAIDSAPQGGMVTLHTMDHHSDMVLSAHFEAEAEGEGIHIKNGLGEYVAHVDTGAGGAHKNQSRWSEKWGRASALSTDHRWARLRQALHLGGHSEDRHITITKVSPVDGQSSPFGVVGVKQPSLEGHTSTFHLSQPDKVTECCLYTHSDTDPLGEKYLIASSGSKEAATIVDKHGQLAAKFLSVGLSAKTLIGLPRDGVDAKVERHGLQIAKGQDACVIMCLVIASAKLK